MIRFLLLALALLCLAPGAHSEPTIEKIATPEGVDPQIGGLDFLPDGRLAACFHRGEVAFYDPAAKTWQMYAKGLHEPLGIAALAPDNVVVMQRPELTRLRDTTGDGQADVYQTLFDGFGMTGNYHEFAFGPAVDRNGDFYIALNVASNGASIRPEIRGRWMEIGVPREDFYTNWSKVKGAAGRMYSRVPYRGWVMKIDALTGETTPWACGFRSPDGIGFDSEGRLFVTDNQGDWLGTSKLFQVRQDGFHGHPASLVWREGWTENPLKMDVKELEALRQRAVVLFPQGLMANSPTQPLPFPESSAAFGPFAGQLLVGEMNNDRLLRIMLEEVDGTLQGAVVPFLDRAGLSPGNHRMAFARDGALWIGKTHLSWAGGAGLLRVTGDGQPALDVLAAHIEKDGFTLDFTLPANKSLASDPANYAVERYRYDYHQAYGSPQREKSRLPVTSATLSPDAKSVRLVIEDMKPDFVYQIQTPKLASADGQVMRNPLLCYTATKIPD